MGLPIIGEQLPPQNWDPLDSSRTPFRLPRMSGSGCEEEKNDDPGFRIWSRHGYEVYKARFMMSVLFGTESIFTIDIYFKGCCVSKISESL